MLNPIQLGENCGLQVSPLCLGTSPAIAFSKVDFPAPFGPTSATRLPQEVAIETESSARISRYATDKPAITSSW